MGTLSRSAFFTNLAIVFSTRKFVAEVSLAFALPLSALGGTAKGCGGGRWRRKGPLARMIVKSFSPKGKLSQE
jgi:hypothetical protein